MKAKMRRYRAVTAFMILSMMWVSYCGTAKAMEQTVYGYPKVSLSDVRRDFLEKCQEKRELLRYRDIGKGDWPLVDSVQLIYEKHYIDDPDRSSNAPYCTYNAKGNFYAEVVDKGSSRIVLVYDGMSENGKCYLFVAEKENFGADGSKLDNTSLLEFYAVNLEKQEVYEAHKTTWGGPESEGYREATKE